MDEGWATFLTAKFMSTIDSSRTTLGSLSGRYGRLAGTEYDIPLRVPTSLLRFSSYRFAAYSRSSIAYALLENALGAEKFKKGVQYYMQIWNGKHPIPTDFFGCMVKGTDEKFIIEQMRRTWFESFGYADLALKKVKVKKHSAKVTVEKKGLFPVPVRINVLYADSSEESFQWPLTEWLRSKTNVKTFKIKLKKEVLKIWLEDRAIPDAVRENNRISLEK
jgi:aminopeptidase N